MTTKILQKPNLCGEELFKYLLSSYNGMCSVNQALVVRLVTKCQLSLELASFIDKVKLLFTKSRSSQVVDFYLFEQAAEFLLKKDKITVDLFDAKPNAVRKGDIYSQQV